MVESPETNWTIRVALLCLVAVLVARGAGSAALPWRILWSIGVLSCVLHFLFAFRDYHAWSHAQAAAHAGEQTEALLGWKFPQGIYFNYLFLLLWSLDALWWWLRPNIYRQRPASWNWSVYGYLLFIAVNGAIIFESGLTRWAGLALLAIGSCLVFYLRAVKRNDPA